MRRTPWIAVCSLALLAACGGGSSGGGGGTVPAAVTVSGTVTFDLVPAVIGVGLDYAATRQAPARAVTVEVINAAGGALLGTGVTDDAGRYAITVPAQTRVFVRARARLLRTGTPAWDMRVLDNTQGDAEYVLDGPAFDSGVTNQTRNLHAVSGWNGTQYAGIRAAAPFAILDVIYEGMQRILAVDAAAVFPPLQVHWSVNNVPNLGAFDPTVGDIGTSFYAPGSGMYLLGAEDVDTDEYDRHVIAHEWGHYVERSFSRSDPISGLYHTFGDQLDLRLAFREGWGNAFSAIVTGQSTYRDVLDIGQTAWFSFDVEGEPPENPGWYSEQSVQEILYDLYDDTAEDAVSLGFAPLYHVLVNAQRLTPALTSVFSFVSALKAEQPAAAGAIDNLVSAQSIDAIADAFASGETHAGNPADAELLPIYADLAVNGGAVNVCSTDAYTSPYTDSYNKLGSRRFLRFSAPQSGEYVFSASATLVPAGQSSDPDFRLYHVGQILPACVLPTDACPGESPVVDSETFSWPLDAGDYVLEVYEWSNTNGHSDSRPPIGRTCFDVEVTGP